MKRDRFSLDAGASIHHDLDEERGIWLQVVTGVVLFAGVELAAGDGASSESPGQFPCETTDRSAEASLFDLG